ncbi:MAG: hypothetical protein SFU25_10060, partial [Candidatus Caenarcaniphilales bacterium]|nr:hypothetical protein [Candidatus Caenarcaniphilales bacterium]
MNTLAKEQVNLQLQALGATTESISAEQVLNDMIGQGLVSNQMNNEAKEKLIASLDLEIVKQKELIAEKEKQKQTENQIIDLRSELGAAKEGGTSTPKDLIPALEKANMLSSEQAKTEFDKAGLGKEYLQAQLMINSQKATELEFIKELNGSLDESQQKEYDILQTKIKSAEKDFEKEGITKSYSKIQNDVFNTTIQSLANEGKYSELLSSQNKSVQEILAKKQASLAMAVAESEIAERVKDLKASQQQLEENINARLEEKTKGEAITSFEKREQLKNIRDENKELISNLKIEVETNSVKLAAAQQELALQNEIRKAKGEQVEETSAEIEHYSELIANQKAQIDNYQKQRGIMTEQIKQLMVVERLGKGGSISKSDTGAADKKILEERAKKQDEIANTALDKEKTLLDLRKTSGKITEEQYTKENKAILEQKAVIEAAALERLKMSDAKPLEILQQENKLLQIKMQIEQDVVQQREKNNNLARLTIDLNENNLEVLRETGKISAEQYDQSKLGFIEEKLSLEQAILQEMINQNASQEQIIAQRKTVNSLEINAAQTRKAEEKKILDLRSAGLALMESEIQLQLQTGSINQLEGLDKTIEMLEKRLQIEEDTLAMMKKQGASQQELIQQQTKINQAKGSINQSTDQKNQILFEQRKINLQAEEDKKNKALAEEQERNAERRKMFYKEQEERLADIQAQQAHRKELANIMRDYANRIKDTIKATFDKIKGIVDGFKIITFTDKYEDYERE